MEIKFIGTGSGKTSLKRYHSSFLINSGNFNLLVDAGDSISRALLNQKILYNFIDGVIISHLHPDHYTGLPSLLVQMKMSERVNPFYIFCHESYSRFIKEFIFQSYLFEDKLGFKINFESFPNDTKYVIDADLSFTAKQNSHLEKNITVDNSKSLSFSSCGFLFKVKEKNIFFTGDIGNLKDLFLFHEIKLDWMITEITHITTDELIDSFKKLKPERLVITHLSEEDEIKVSKLSFQLPGEDRRKIVSAFDGLNIKI